MSDLTLWPLKNTILQEQEQKINDENIINCKYITIENDNELGNGNFSIVKKCKNLFTNDLYAMKLINKNLLINDKLQLIQKEVQLLRLISDKIRTIESNNNHSDYDIFQGHHHVLQLFDFFETNENIILITQLCNNYDLYDLILQKNHLDLNYTIKPYIACIVSILDFLHDENIIHRDLKAENILIRLRNNQNKHISHTYDPTSHDLVLADFGLATKIDNNNINCSSLKQYVGTISYISPEIVKFNQVNHMKSSSLSKLKPYNKPVDIWALGVLTYFMNFGFAPFDCDNDDETLQCITKCDYYIDNDMNQIELNEFWNFINCCLEIDEDKRFNTKQLKNHPFIKDYFNVIDNNDNDFINLKKCLSSSSLKSTTTKISPKSFNKLKNNLKKTLSMTSIDQSRSNAMINKNSTFILDPKPPTNSLMNGCFSTPPECKDFNSTTPRSLSRQNSNSNTSLLSINNSSNLSIPDLLIDLNNENKTYNNNNNIPKQLNKPIFQIGLDDDDDE